MNCPKCKKENYSVGADTHEVFETEYEYECECGHGWVSTHNSKRPDTFDETMAAFNSIFLIS